MQVSLSSTRPAAGVCWAKMEEPEAVGELLRELPSLARPEEWSTVSNRLPASEDEAGSYERKVWLPKKSFVEVGFATGDPLFLYQLPADNARGGPRRLWSTSEVRSPGGLCDHGILASAWPSEKLKKGEGVLSSAVDRASGFRGDAPISFLPLKTLLKRAYATREARRLSHRVVRSSKVTLHLVSRTGTEDVENGAARWGQDAHELSFVRAFVRQMLARKFVAVGLPVCFSLGGVEHRLRIASVEEAVQGPNQAADGLHPVFYLVDDGAECVIEEQDTDEAEESSRSAAAAGASLLDEVVSSAPGESTEHASDLIERSLRRAEYVQEADFTSLGGLAKEVKCIRKVLSIPWNNIARFRDLGLRTPRGVMLHGPPGTGKTRLAYAAARETGAKLYVLNGPDLVSQFQGESEAGLRAVFESAVKNEPAIIFIDEIDAIVPSRESNQNLAAGSAFSDRITAELLNLMDHGLSSGERVVVIAATNRIDAIDKSVRRPGRFDYEIEVGVPTPLDRLEILRIFLQGIRHSLTEDEVKGIAMSTHGFTGADLKALCNEASLVSIEDLAENPGVDLESFFVCRAHFEAARRSIVPSAMREVLFRVPDVSWDDIGGRAGLKKRLRDIIKLQTEEDLFSGLRIKPLKGILLYGPPGCSKTMLVKAVASQSNLNFINVKGPELLNKYVGESEKAIKTIFSRAKAASPAIIFIDEIDGLVTARTPDSSVTQNRVLTQLLTEIDGISQKHRVAVIGATNRPDRLDLAILRPGRFDWLLYVPPPDHGERREVLRCLFAKTPLDGDEDLEGVCESFASRTVGYSPADLLALVRQAALLAIEEDFGASAVGAGHLERSMESVQPSLKNLDPGLVELYKKFERSGLASASR